jgi:hypothetical protein
LASSVRLLTQAEAMDNPWSAYYNAQGLYDKKCLFCLLVRAQTCCFSVHADRLLARLLPTYGVLYISSLFTVAQPEEGQAYKQGDHIF